jgi:hypothetical protein
MNIISHRGNLTGPNHRSENTESYLIQALNKSFDIEFDVWYTENKFWLGHDFPVNVFSLDTLVYWSSKYFDRKFYVHCKNILALENIVKLEKVNIIPFFHDSDQCILLKTGKIWVHPKAVHNVFDKTNSIAVVSSCKKLNCDVELNLDFSDFYGVCTDYPSVVLENMNR